MERETAIKWYQYFDASDRYLLGFIYNHNLYAIELKDIPNKFIHFSSGRLYLYLTDKYKKQLIGKGAILFGEEELLYSSTYNKGDVFESLILECCFEQKWKKNNTPFWEGGDAVFDGRHYQIKFENATLAKEKQLEKLKKIKKVSEKYLLTGLTNIREVRINPFTIKDEYKKFYKEKSVGKLKKIVTA